MRLKEYFDEYGTTIARLARKAEMPTQTLYNILNGADCRLSIAAKLERATKGKVKCIDIDAEIRDKKEELKKVDDKNPK